MVGKKRARGRRGPVQVPSVARWRRANSTRPSASLRATMRTVMSCGWMVVVGAGGAVAVSGAGGGAGGGAAGRLMVNGELCSQRSTVASAGKKRRAGNIGSPQEPVVARWRRPNSIRSSARLRATMRTSSEPLLSAAWAVAGDASAVPVAAARTASVAAAAAIGLARRRAIGPARRRAIGPARRRRSALPGGGRALPLPIGARRGRSGRPPRRSTVGRHNSAGAPVNHVRRAAPSLLKASRTLDLWSHSILWRSTDPHTRPQADCHTPVASCASPEGRPMAVEMAIWRMTDAGPPTWAPVRWRAPV